MFRSLLLRQSRQFHFTDPTNLCESQLQSKPHLNPKKMQAKLPEPVPFIYVDKCELRLAGDVLHHYRQDKLKFIARVECIDEECSEDHAIYIIPEPIKVHDDCTYFLLLYRWSRVPNQRLRVSRRNSGRCQMQLDSDLFDVVYILAESIYVGKMHSTMLNHLLDKNGGKLQNQLYIVPSREKEDNKESTNVSTSRMNRVVEEFEQSHQTDDDKQWNRNSFSGPIEIHSMVANCRRDAFAGCSKVGIKKKVKQLFTSVTYLRDTDLNEKEKLMEYIEDKNSMVAGSLVYESVVQLIQGWQKYRVQHQQFDKFNMKCMLQMTLNKSICNYKSLAQLNLIGVSLLDLRCLQVESKNISLEIIKEFLQSMKYYLNEKECQECYERLVKALKEEEVALLRNYQDIKRNYGRKVIESWEVEAKKTSQYVFETLYGDPQLDSLNIGYGFYQEIVQSKITTMFDEIRHARKNKKKKIMCRVENTHDFLNNLENRIEILKEKKKYLSLGIQISSKEAESLNQLLRGIQHKKGENTIQMVQINR